MTRIKNGGGKNKEERLQEALTNYLTILREVEEKVTVSYGEFQESTTAPKQNSRLEQIKLFLDYLTKHIDLIHRRLVLGETIPHEEKLFSLFEPHTEWVTKGKARPNVELGHRLLVTTNQNGFIVDHKVMEKTTDSTEVPELIERLRQRYDSVASLSFDKGFYSAENKEKVAEFADLVVMPKKGKLTKAEQEEQRSPQFQKLRHAHSAIESDINCLEHHGLDRCPDKGLSNYKRYVALGVLTYNLHKVGNNLMGIKRGKQTKARAA